MTDGGGGNEAVDAAAAGASGAGTAEGESGDSGESAGPLAVSLTLWLRRRRTSGRGVGFSAPAPYGPGDMERAPGWYAT